MVVYSYNKDLIRKLEKEVEKDIVSIVIFGEIREHVAFLSSINTKDYVVVEGVGAIIIEDVDGINSKVISRRVRYDGLMVSEIEVTLERCALKILRYLFKYSTKEITFEDMYNGIEKLECKDEMERRRNIVLRYLSYLVV